MYSIGIDIGGTKIALAIVSENSGIEISTRIPTPKKSVNEFVNKICNEIKKIIDDSGVDKNSIIGVGIGAPGPVNFKKQLVRSFTHIPIDGFEIGKEISKLLNLPAVLDNDGNLAAIGEKRWGNAKDFNDFIILTLGTGIGSGIYESGHIVRGSEGYAAEIGHMVIDLNGPGCDCGSNGCYETFVSGPAIKDLALKQKDKLKFSMIFELADNHFSRVTSEMVLSAANRADKYAIEVFNTAGYYLGVGISNLLNIFNPEAIIIGGGLGTAAKDLLIAPAIMEVKKRALAANAENIKIINSGLENNAGVLGAAALVFDIFS